MQAEGKKGIVGTWDQTKESISRRKEASNCDKCWQSRKMKIENSNMKNISDFDKSSQAESWDQKLDWNESEREE